ncbi:MAG TPA: hypothetical protein VFW80_14285 [Gaiellaceae bacterium]|nr:hypothetical protein [Gaiellaceae bacterium]
MKTGARARWVGALAVLAGLVCAGSALAAPGPCATVMPLDDVAAGQVGEGWTVVEGTEPDPFDVEVLGVAKDIVAPGRDVIVVRISGATVDAGGGVWEGMSGSPVYIGGDFAGALAYGFSLGASDIAGLTPAEDMLDLDGLPVASRLPKRLRLPRALVRAIAKSTGAALPEGGGTLVRLKVPVSVSGIGLGHAQYVKKVLRRHGLDFTLTSGASALTTLAGTVDDLAPGGNFAAALSYGDVTAAGIGTTSYVCDGQALAFGHPFFLTGRAALGAGGADALAIVPDPFGPYKLANVTGPVGVMDQDRFAGVRAVDGGLSTIPVSTAVTALDTAAVRTGETDVVQQSDLPELGTTHVIGSIDSTFDAIGEGSSAVAWAIHGLREDGSPWTLRRSNRFASKFDISSESAFELYDALSKIARYPFEDVEVTSVEADVEVESTVRRYRLARVLVCHSGECRAVRRLRAHPGKTLSFRAVLRPEDGSAAKLVPFKLTIPPRAHGGALVEVTGGSGCRGQFDPRCRQPRPLAFDLLLRELRRVPENNVLSANLETGSHGRVPDRFRELLDRVVSGAVRIPVFFPNQCCPPKPGGSVGGVPIPVPVP